MKISALSQKLAPALPLLRCPLCGEAFALEGIQVQCANRHSFDLSAKGYLNLAPGHAQSGEKYDRALFESRRRIFADGFYRPVLQAVQALLPQAMTGHPFALLDAGCGEGYYARQIAADQPAASCFGLDLSRDGIVQAARGGSPVHWLVADLKKLPFADHSLDVVLDVLTPADYREFARVLKPGGVLIKVIPGSQYLQEIRVSVREHLRSQDYDPSRVLDHLQAHAKNVDQRTVCQAFPLAPQQSRDFLAMTPMTFSVAPEVLEQTVLPSITIHMEVLSCRFA